MPKAKVRLHQAAVMCGYRRSKHATEHKFALLAIEDVRTKKQTRFYMGKRCVFVHPGKTPITARKGSGKTTRMRRMWGKIVRHHGKAGLVRAVFKPNLPGQAIGKKIRVFLYPSSI
jgi:large subunit ribosomal protein L35Ae